MSELQPLECAQSAPPPPPPDFPSPLPPPGLPLHKSFRFRMPPTCCMPKKWRSWMFQASPPCLGHHRLPQDLSARSSGALPADAKRGPSAEKENVRSAGRHWITIQCKRLFVSAVIAAKNPTNPGREKERCGDCVREGVGSAKKAHLVPTRPSLAFHPGGGVPALQVPTLGLESGCGRPPDPLHC